MCPFLNSELNMEYAYCLLLIYSLFKTYKNNAKRVYTFPLIEV